MIWRATQILCFTWCNRDTHAPTWKASKCSPSKKPPWKTQRVPHSFWQIPDTVLHGSNPSGGGGLLSRGTLSKSLDGNSFWKDGGEEMRLRVAEKRMKNNDSKGRKDEESGRMVKAEGRGNNWGESKEEVIKGVKREKINWKNTSVAHTYWT